MVKPQKRGWGSKRLAGDSGERGVNSQPALHLEVSNSREYAAMSSERAVCSWETTFQSKEVRLTPHEAVDLGELGDFRTGNFKGCRFRWP